MRIFCYAEGVTIGRMTVTGLAFQPVANDSGALGREHTLWMELDAMDIVVAMA